MTYRRGALSVVAFGAGDAEAGVGGGAGVVRSAGSRPMAPACHRIVWVGNQHRAKMHPEPEMIAFSIYKFGSHSDFANGEFAEKLRPLSPATRRGICLELVGDLKKGRGFWRVVSE